MIARGRLSPAKNARETNAEEIGLLMGGSFIGAQGVKAGADATLFGALERSRHAR